MSLENTQREQKHCVFHVAIFVHVGAGFFSDMIYFDAPAQFFHSGEASFDISC